MRGDTHRVTLLSSSSDPLPDSASSYGATAAGTPLKGGARGEPSAESALSPSSMVSTSIEADEGHMPGPSHLEAPSMMAGVGVEALVQTPEQKRTARLASYALGTVLLVIAVLIIVAVWQLIVNPKERHIVAAVTAAFFVAIAVPLSLNDIHLHMVHYVRPDMQRYYIRILWMVPLYAIESWLALRYKDQSIYFETAREAYEAYVIYSFFQMLTAFCGGNERLNRLLLEKALVKGHSTAHMLPPFCCLRPWRINTNQFLHRCRVGVFQYVVLRVTLAILTFVLELCDAYGEGEWTNFRRPFVYFAVVLNLSQFAAMYCLVLIYHECMDILKPLKPFPKFVAVKAIVFFSFWQGILISALVREGRA